MPALPGWMSGRRGVSNAIILAQILLEVPPPTILHGSTQPILLETNSGVDHMLFERH